MGGRRAGTGDDQAGGVVVGRTLGVYSSNSSMSSAGLLPSSFLLS